MAGRNTANSGTDDNANNNADNTVRFYNQNRFTVEVELTPDTCIVFLPHEIKDVPEAEKNKVSAKGLQEVNK